MNEELIGGYIHPEMSHEEALRLQQELADWDWEKFRREAAKDILCSVLSVPGMWEETKYDGLAAACIKQADELIKQLKGDGKD